MLGIDNATEKEFDDSLGLEKSWKSVYGSIRRSVTESEEWLIQSEFTRITRRIFLKQYINEILMDRLHTISRHRTTIETSPTSPPNVANRSKNTENKEQPRPTVSQSTSDQLVP